MLYLHLNGIGVNHYSNLEINSPKENGGANCMTESIVSARQMFELSRAETYVTEHYVFHYQAGTLAEKEIKTIAKHQEQAFLKICSGLEIQFPALIHYYFSESPSEIGSIFWGEGASCNGCAICEDNKIYAVYSEDIKCIGEHEDTHLISYFVGEPESYFLSEGLAMHFHGHWWGEPNEKWAAYFKATNPQISVEDMLDNAYFSEYGEEITYPLAGAFTKFLIETYGLNRYKELYRYDGVEYGERIKAIYHASLPDIEQSFWASMGMYF